MLWLGLVLAVEQGLIVVSRKKQWKAQLNRWQFRKRLSKEDAAQILYLLQEAGTNGVQRRVLFNHIPKRIEDIDSYIRKSDLVKSREELLEYLVLEDRSPYITCEDGSHDQPFSGSSNDVVPTAAAVDARTTYYNPSHNPEVTQAWHATIPATYTADAPPTTPVRTVQNTLAGPSPQQGPAAFSFQIPIQPAGTAMDRQSSNSSMDFEKIPHVEDVESLSSDSSAGEDPWSSSPADDHQPGPTHSQIAAFDMNGPGPHADAAVHVRIPQDALPNAMAYQVDPARLNGLLSNSPLQTHLSAETLTARINGMFCSIDAVGSDASSQRRVAMFLRHCCGAIIYRGQEYYNESRSSVAEAVAVFVEILRENPWDALTTLNNMLALLAQYGHRIAIHDILKAVEPAVSNYMEENHRPLFSIVVQQVMRFMIEIPEVGIKPDYDVESLVKMEDQARASFDDHPEFSLSAAYIHAWVLLEMKRGAEALKMLSDQRPECEEVFGYGQFQTICWIATSARAYAAIGQYKMAANTYRDVAGRIGQYFSPSHPQYWDSRYRQAIFDMNVIDDCVDAERKRQGYVNVARSLKATLLWRAEHLGGPNPLTLQNLKACGRVLEKLGKADRYPTFDQVVSIKLP